MKKYLKNNSTGNILPISQNLGAGFGNQNWIKATSAEIKSFLKKDLIFNIKKEAAQRINILYPDYKQRNYLAQVAKVHNKILFGGGSYAPTQEESDLLAEAEACDTHIASIRAKSKAIIDSLDSKTQIQLEDFDFSENSKWE